MQELERSKSLKGCKQSHKVHFIKYQSKDHTYVEWNNLQDKAGKDCREVIPGCFYTSQNSCAFCLFIL